MPYIFVKNALKMHEIAAFQSVRKSKISLGSISVEARTSLEVSRTFGPRLRPPLPQ